MYVTEENFSRVQSEAKRAGHRSMGKKDDL